MSTMEIKRHWCFGSRGFNGHSVFGDDPRKWFLLCQNSSNERKTWISCVRLQIIRQTRKFIIQKQYFGDCSEILSIIPCPHQNIGISVKWKSCVCDENPYSKMLWHWVFRRETCPKVNSLGDIKTELTETLISRRNFRVCHKRDLKTSD